MKVISILTAISQVFAADQALAHSVNRTFFHGEGGQINVEGNLILTTSFIFDQIKIT